MAKKVILKDLNDIEVLPITRGELILDSSGNLALHSTLFLATDSLPGLMSSEDKYKLDNLENSGPGANNKVAQINTTTNDVYRLLFSETADDTDRTEKSRKSANLTFNPSTGVLNLTGNINANGGTFNSQIISNVADGTAPLTVISTTKVANLNADKLDGYDSTDIMRIGTWSTVDNQSGNLIIPFLGKANPINSSEHIYGSVLQWTAYLNSTPGVSNDSWYYLLWGVTSYDRLYFRKRTNTGSWSKAQALAFTSDIPTITDYYWANIKVQSSEDKTTVPTFGGIVDTPYIRSNTTDGYYIGNRNTGAGTTDNGLMLYTYGSNPISLYTKGTERIRILPNGYVGIGTNNPSRKLDVVGSTIITSDTRYVLEINSTVANAIITFKGTDGSEKGQFGRGNGLYGFNYEAYRTNSKGVTAFGIDDNANFYLGTGGLPSVTDSKVVVLANGNVGIGITNPTYNLHVKGTTKTEALLLFDNNTSNSTPLSYWGIYGWNDRLSFSKRNSSNTYLSEPLCILYDTEYVGIGTTNPDCALDVVGTIGSNNIRINTTIKDNIKPTNQCLVINSSTVPSNTSLTLKNSPGIGFHISGVTWASLVYGYNSRFNFINSSADGYAPVAASGFIKAGSNDDYVLLGGGGHKAISTFAMASDLGNYVTINTDQTITGSKIFESASNYVGVSLKLRNKNWLGGMSTAIDFYTGGSKSAVSSRISDYMNGDGSAGGCLRFFTQSASSTNPNPNNLTERMRIDNYGFVRVYGNLNITSDARDVLYLNSNASGGPLIKIQQSGTDKAWYGYSPTIKGIYWFNANDTGIFLSDTDLVGIGTTSPKYKLDVNGTARATSLMSSNIRIECDNSGVLGSRGSEINNYNSHLYLNHNSSTNIIMAMGGGNVGIGTANPSYKLDVSGTFNSSNYQVGSALELKTDDTTCQTTIFGSNSSGYRMRIIRQSTATNLNTLYSPTLVVSSLDTHAYIAWDYNGTNVWVGGGSGNKWNWRSMLINTSNYSSILDGRYYTETEADNRFVNVTGDTMTGVLTMNTGTGIQMKYTNKGNDPWMYPNGAVNYGIRYFEGDVDKMTLSATGNNNSISEADLCINGNGDGTVTIRGKNILTEATAPYVRRLYYRNDYEHYVVLLCKYGTNLTNTYHRVSGKIYSEAGGGNRYVAADIDVFVSDWTSSMDSKLRFDSYGIAQMDLVTCTYGGSKYLAIRIVGALAKYVYFVGTSANILFTPIYYYNENTGSVINSEIRGSISAITVGLPYSNGIKYALVNDNITGNAASATKVIVNQHTANNTEYPLIWSNLNNTNTVTENLLYKSYSHLTYNPSAHKITTGQYVANNSTGPHFTGTSTAGNWVYLRLNNSSVIWDIATKSTSGSGGLWLSRYKGLDNGIFVSAADTPKVGINNSSPSYALHVSGDIYATGWSRAGSGFYVEGQGVHYMAGSAAGIGQIYLTNNEFNWGAGNANLYFNHRAAANGTTVTNYIWNAGSSSSYASHTMGLTYFRGSGKYLRIGPQNGSHAHYETDAGVSHWFNKTVQVDGNIEPYGNNEHSAGSTSYRFSNVYSYAGNFAGTVSINCAYPNIVCNNNASGAIESNIRFEVGGANKGYIGYSVNYGTYLLNSKASKYVYIADNGYFYTQSYINVGAGNEKNASNPPYVWGVNGSDNFMRTYATSNLSVGTAATCTGNATGLSSSGYGNGNLTYYQAASDFFGNSGWSHYIIANHGDGSTYYNYTIALPFWDVPKYKRLEGGTADGWHTFITSENISSQSVSYAYSSPAAANWGGTGDTTKIKIKINSTTSWMLSFVVTLYQGYKASKIMISGYNYGSNYWHEPEAVLLGDSNLATYISVYFGYDSAWNLWVGFDGGSYTGVSISDVTNGYTQISSLKGLFTISNVSSLTTLQKTVTAINCVNYAVTANAANYTTRLYANSTSDLITYPGDYSLSYSRFQSNASNIFPVSNNANGCITAHLHSGNYYAQIGLSSNGRMYYRTMMSLALNSGVGWNTVAFTSDLSAYLPISGGTMNGSITMNQTSTNRRVGIIGSYDPNRAAAIWSMGSSYQIAADGTSFGSLYGAAYAYFGSGYTFGANYTQGHSFVWCQAGTVCVLLGNGIWTSGNCHAAHFYENSDKKLKENIQAILNSNNIPQIKEFNWKKSGEHSYGLIAQELEKQGYSELVNETNGIKNVNYSAALSLIVGKLQVKIKELEKEIENLKNKN